MNIKGKKISVKKLGILRSQKIITPTEIVPLFGLFNYSLGIDFEWDLINTRHHKKYVIRTDKKYTESDVKNDPSSTKYCYLGKGVYNRVVAKV